MLQALHFLSLIYLNLLEGMLYLALSKRLACYENCKPFQRAFCNFHILRTSYDWQNIGIQSIDDVTIDVDDQNGQKKKKTKLVDNGN